MKHIFCLKPLLSRNNPKNEAISVFLGNSYQFLWIDIAVRFVVFLLFEFCIKEFFLALLFLNFSFLLITTYYLKRRFKGIQTYLHARLIAYPDFRQSLESKNKLFIYPEKSINKIKYSLFYSFIFVLLSCSLLFRQPYDLLINIVAVFLAAVISFYFAWRYSAIFLKRDISSISIQGEKVNIKMLKKIKDYLNIEDFINDSSLHFKNDMFILKLDKDFNIYKEKLETFLLESVFLGALTFTTFIQIIDNKIWLKYMYSFNSFFNNELTSKIWNGSKLEEKLGFGFLLVGSVVSSIMYMVILMKRFPIIKSIENVRGHLKMAQFYNEKENNETSLASKEIYTQQIQVEIAKCEEQKIMLDSNFRIVSFFRASGLFSFSMVLLVATMMISWVFFMSALIVGLYVFVAANMIDDNTQWRRFIMSNQKQKEVKGGESQ